MTSNERVLSRVADVMDFGHYIKNNENFFPVWDKVSGKLITNNFKFDNTPTGHWLSHLLVEKMVGDGWNVELMHYVDSKFKARAWKDIYETEKYTYCEERSSILNSSAPAAILALFKKVYGITEEA